MQDSGRTSHKGAARGAWDPWSCLALVANEIGTRASRLTCISTSRFSLDQWPEAGTALDSISKNIIWGLVPTVLVGVADALVG